MIPRSLVLFVSLYGLSIGVKASSFTRGSFAEAIQTLGGTVVDPSRFTQDVQGFQSFLNASGISAFSATEMIRPYHGDVAARLGFQVFLPPREWWPRGAALALLAQHIRGLVGNRVSLRNWWRPPAYNRDSRVAGAEHGDHIGAFGIDLDYASAQSRRRAESWLRDLERTAPWMQLSLGLGDRTTHIGLLSERGHREWHYRGYAP